MTDNTTVSYVNMVDVHNSLMATNTQDKLSAFLSMVGCKFHPNTENRLVSEPAVRLAAIGGFQVSKLLELGISLPMAAKMAEESMGLSGGMSYLSLPGNTPQAAYDQIVGKNGHCSVAHVFSVTLLVAGVTCACENEFTIQRDIVHLSRLTEARTGIQTKPPLVVPHAALIEPYMRILEMADKERANAVETLQGVMPHRDIAEATNLMFSASKATAFLLTGTLRNFQKLLSAENDPGKEIEFRKLLGLIRQPLEQLWPSLFETPQGN